MTNPYKLIIFDCDGTLVDSLDGIVRCARLAMDEMGRDRPLAHSEVAQIVGLSLAEAFARLLPGEPRKVIERGVALYKKQYKRLADGGELVTPLYPGVRETLQQLKAAHLTLAIATGKSLPGLQRNLNELNLGGYFDCLRTADHAPSKPHPEMLFQVLQETGFSPREALMVGDTDFDMEMGRAAGVGTCAVTFGCHTREQLARSQPDHWLESMGDLPKLLGVTG